VYIVAGEFCRNKLFQLAAWLKIGESRYSLKWLRVIQRHLINAELDCFDMMYGFSS
jgi:hypothetical protein